MGERLAPRYVSSALGSEKGAHMSRSAKSAMVSLWCYLNELYSTSPM
jgi:hypothetical protein